MNHTAINDINGYIFSSAKIRKAEQISSDLVMYIDKAAVNSRHIENGFGRNMYITGTTVTLRSFTLKSVTLSGRVTLDEDYKKTRTSKDHTLYKSEHTDFTEKLLNDSADIFRMELNTTEKGTVFTAELCFLSDCSIYTAKFLCSSAIIEWDEFGEPVSARKPTLKEKAEQLKLDVPAVFLALGHKDTPRLAKAISAIAVAYALSPIDLIPDFIPVLGYLDDVLILPGLIYMALRLIPSDVMNECRKQTADMWKDGRPKKWYYALPIVLFWIIILALIISALIK